MEQKAGCLLEAVGKARELIMLPSSSWTKLENLSMKPNIISFICHDLGKHLGCYQAMVSSPNLDRFACEGVLFTNAFCGSAACSPSHGCLMTGKSAHSNGLVGLAHTGWGLPFEQKTIVDHLNAAGYETVHIGHNPKPWREPGVGERAPDDIAAHRRRAGLEA
jgi:arylsulfatase A-like enzyme